MKTNIEENKKYEQMISWKYMEYYDKYEEKYKFENDNKYKFIHWSNLFFLILKDEITI